MISSRFKGEPDADDFEGVGKEDGGDTREGTGDESSEGHFLRLVFYDYRADLLVGKELYGGVGEDA